MKYGIGFSTRIAFGVLLLLVAGVLLWVDYQNNRLRDSYMSERSLDLEAALHVDQLRLSQNIETLRKDALFLAATPPVSAIVRAAANNGIDPRDRIPNAVLETQLQEIFAAFLRAHPDYYQASFIGAAGEGLELVRVDNRDGRIEAIPREALQPAGDQEYFRAGLTLTVGRVHLSEFALNRERGQPEAPHRPTLRAVTTVFDAGGRVFGMVVINKDVRPLFSSSLAGLPHGVLGYIADQRGHYLSHPDDGHAFTFEFGNKEEITDDFPSLKPMFEAQSMYNELPFHAVNDGVKGYLAAERVFFDVGDPSRFLLLAYFIPAHMVDKQASGIPLPGFFDMVLAMALVGAAFMLMLRYTFSPLRRVTAEAREIAAGNRQIRLKEKQGGEVGEITGAFNIMLDKLSDSELTGKENAFRKELIESLPGIFCMIDAQGHFLMWNRNLEQVLQRKKGEMASSHPLDFFEGENKANIDNAIRRVFETGQAELDAWLLAKDGSKTFYRFGGKRIQYDGKPVLVGVGLDISSHVLAESVQKRHKAMVQIAHDGYWLADIQGRLLEANQAYADISGYSVEELVGMHISQLEAKEKSPEEVHAHIAKIVEQGFDVFETQHRHKDGHAIDIEVTVTLMRDTQQLVAFCRDISARKRSEEALRVAAAVFETHDAILITDAQANIVRVNRAFSEITGYTAGEVIGKNPRIMSSGRQDKAFYVAMWQQLLATGSWSGEIWDRRKDGEIYPKWLTITAVKNERGDTTQYVAIFSDITARKQEEELIRSMAFYDALTQLPNRRLFLERLQAALAASERYNDFGAILFIDLDRFKQLNDTFGHDYGDLLLVELAERIKSCVREIDTVARMGGDEFVVLLESTSSEREDAAHNAGMVAEKIREILSYPYQLREHEHLSSPSIGISLYHANDLPMDVLLKHADAAMYRSKEEGGNMARFYDAELQEKWQTGTLKPSR
ncbi:MAG: PAS domain S-box protein [Nitrosomonadales bacterium]|nr:PAS domain S-box protein [Nitrosomonadales bacterium]